MLPSPLLRLIKRLCMLAVMLELGVLYHDLFKK